MPDSKKNSDSKTHDLLIIGAGPGGYVAAIKAAQLGLNVACVDKNETLGGTCLRVGCIPSKAMLESSERYEAIQHEASLHGIKVKDIEVDVATMVKRKATVVSTMSKGIQGLFKKNKVTLYTGTAKFNPDQSVTVTTKDGEVNVVAENVIIATGSKSATLPSIDMDIDGVDTNIEALDYEKVPKKLAVIGGGYIGLELSSVWRRLGAEVTVIEYLDRVLPGIDEEIAKEAHKAFKKQGVNFMLGSKVTGVKKTKNGISVEIEGKDAVEADRVLVAVGRKPNTDGLGLDAIGVEVNERGYIPVNGHFETNVKNVYAVGDVIPGPMLAHVAEEEGIACVEHIVNGSGHVDYDVIPAVVYTHPEIAAVGKLEDQLKKDGVKYKAGSFPFLANGRAHALGDANGKVKVLVNEHDRVIGVHIIGPRAGDLIAEAAAAMAYGASAEDIARVCHAHPTLSEALKEAAMAAYDKPIHM